MDILLTPWVNVSTRAGQVAKIIPSELSNPEWIDIIEPRPDFKCAVYQFLIGLLQTSFRLECDSDWEEYWESPPDSSVLNQSFSKFKHAFCLNNPGGPAFMQDLELNEGEELPIANLLIESPGENTIKGNKDLFVKRHRFNKFCEACAFKALFTLQINAPSGGQGHRVSLRGGGPLTTLVLPDDPKASLWQRLWLNVLTLHQLSSGFENTRMNADKDIFPWLAPTLTSEKSNSSIYPAQANPLQMYWPMPRRIRINFNHTTAGLCDLCGAQHEALISSYQTKNYGMNYEGAWVHPLTPYRQNKDGDLPLSIKGQVNGIGYQHWLGLVLGYDKEFPKQSPALVVKYMRRGFIQSPLIWCFGYDMDNMKARCWYENQLPVFSVISENELEGLRDCSNEIINLNRECLKLLKTHVKQAWFSDTSSKEGVDMQTLEKEFWQKSENQFYVNIESAFKIVKNSENKSFNHFVNFIDIYKKSLTNITSLSIDLFDKWTLANNLSELETKELGRIFKARKYLIHWLKYSKTLKKLKEIIDQKTVEVSI